MGRFDRYDDSRTHPLLRRAAGNGRRGGHAWHTARLSDRLHSGSYSINLDLSQTATYTGAFLTANGGTTAGAEAALFAGMRNGRAYFNIHSTAFPGGEIRGFLAAVPEPQTWAMLIAGFGVIGGAMRRRQRLSKPIRALV